MRQTIVAEQLTHAVSVPTPPSRGCPRTVTGKSTEGETVNALTIDQIRGDVAELLYLDPSDVDDTANLLTEGLDSVRILMLVERWRNAGAKIDFMQLAEAPTLLAWWQALSARQPGAVHG